MTSTIRIFRLLHCTKKDLIYSSTTLILKGKQRKRKESSNGHFRFFTAELQLLRLQVPSSGALENCNLAEALTKRARVVVLASGCSRLSLHCYWPGYKGHPQFSDRPKTTQWARLSAWICSGVVTDFILLWLDLPGLVTTNSVWLDWIYTTCLSASSHTIF